MSSEEFTAVDVEKWRERIHKFAQTVEEAKLELNKPYYGQDFDLDDLTGPSSEDDIWDIPDEDWGDITYDSSEEPDVELLDAHSVKHDQGWLRDKCKSVSARKSGLNAAELEQQLLALLASDSQGMFSNKTIYSLIPDHGFR